MSDATLSPIRREVAAAAAEWFARLQDEDATAQDFQEWQRWLNAEPEHHRAYRDIEHAWRLIGDVQPEAWPSRHAPASRSSPGLRWSLAAMVLLAITAFSTYWIAGRHESYSTRTAEQRSVRLPDGSRVTLGAQSEVTPKFESDVRRVVLSFGEAFFEVARDPQRPFIVMAGTSEIRAVGTAFNVRTTGDRVLVSVTEGHVAVRTSDRRVMLAAGEQVAVTSAGAVEEKAPTPSAVTWLQGRFEYRGEELRHVVEDLNRYTDRHIVLADESVASLRYSGTVFPDHLDEWLQGISGVLPVTVHDNGERREIAQADTF